MELIRSTAGVPPATTGRNPAARRAIEKAMGQSGDALLQRVQRRLETYPTTIQPGCEVWPDEVHGVQPFLRWRDSRDAWGFLGYEIGDDYVFTVAPYDPALPKWMRQMVDSLTAESVGEKPEWEIPEVKRPSGDPIPLVLLVRAKLEEDLEPYESTLFKEQFLARDYIHCEWKTSGYEVVEYADTLPRLDLILLDIRLPYEDGYAAMKKILIGKIKGHPHHSCDR